MSKLSAHRHSKLLFKLPTHRKQSKLPTNEYSRTPKLSILGHSDLLILPTRRRNGLFKPAVHRRNKWYRPLTLGCSSLFQLPVLGLSSLFKLPQAPTDNELHQFEAHRQGRLLLGHKRAPKLTLGLSK